MTAEPRVASWAALVAPPHALGTTALLLGVLAPAFSFFVTATVLPTVVGDIGGLPFYAWASTAYAVASILGSAASPLVVARAGTRAALMLGAIAFVAGAVSCAAATGMPILAVGRALQGFGGGMMVAGLHNAVRGLYPAMLWPHVFGAMSGAWGIAAISGPALGGAITALAGWRSAFVAVIPLALVAAVMTWRILPGVASDTRSGTRVPIGRLTLMCAGVLCVGSVANLSSTAARLFLIAGALVAIGAMLRIDARAEPRLFPSGMLSLGDPIGVGFWMIFFLAISTTPGSVYVPLLLQALHGVPPATAGYLYAAQSLSWTIATLVVARLAGRRVRIALLIGPLSILAGFVGLSQSIDIGPVWLIALFIVLVGAGIGTCWAHVSSLVLGSARPGEQAVTASLVPTTQTFAVSLGAALCGIIANAAGLSAGATRPAAALAGTWLFGAFLLAPLGAFIAASRLGAAGRAR